MKRLNFEKLSKKEAKEFVNLRSVNRWKFIGLFSIIIFEWVLDTVLTIWVISLLLPIWVSVLIGIILGFVISYPYKIYYFFNYSLTYLYYWLAFRKDKIMMSLVEEI